MFSHQEMEWWISMLWVFSIIKIMIMHVSLQSNKLTLFQCLLFTQELLSGGTVILCGVTASWARFTNKVKSIIINLNFSSSQLARISLDEFVSKLILP